MTSATKTRKTTKQQPRSAKLMQLPGGSLILWLTVADQTQAYSVTPLASDFGAAFHLHKADRGDGQTELYDVLLHGRQSSCTCKGNTYRGKCKHVEALTALVQSGKLAVREPEPQPEAEEEETVEITAEPPQPAKPEYCPHCGHLESEHISGFCPA
jgi:hypothetical protein